MQEARATGHPTHTVLTCCLGFLVLSPCLRGVVKSRVRLALLGVKGVRESMLTGMADLCREHRW